MTNLCIPEMTGLRNLSKQGKTSYAVNLEWKKQRGLFTIHWNIKLLLIFAESSIVDIWLGSEYTSELYHSAGAYCLLHMSGKL